jgi:hypothetical protein
MYELHKPRIPGKRINHQETHKPINSGIDKHGTPGNPYEHPRTSRNPYA